MTFGRGVRPPARKPISAECSKARSFCARELVVSAVPDEDGFAGLNPQPSGRFQVDLRIGLPYAGRAGKDRALEVASQRPERPGPDVLHEAITDDGEAEASLPKLADQDCDLLVCGGERRRLFTGAFLAGVFNGGGIDAADQRSGNLGQRVAEGHLADDHARTSDSPRDAERLIRQSKRGAERRCPRRLDTGFRDECLEEIEQDGSYHDCMVLARRPQITSLEGAARARCRRADRGARQSS